VSEIVELSTGHVFVLGSVKAIEPGPSDDTGRVSVNCIGVGFVVTVWKFVDKIDVPEPSPRRASFEGGRKGEDAYVNALHEWWSRYYIAVNERKPQALAELMKECKQKLLIGSREPMAGYSSDLPPLSNRR